MALSSYACCEVYLIADDALSPRLFKRDERVPRSMSILEQVPAGIVPKEQSKNKPGISMQEHMAKAHVPTDG
jgi:hypothetical protein